MGSRDATGVERNRFELNISFSDCNAACVCPTEISPSACRKTVSGFEKGAIVDVSLAEFIVKAHGGER